MSATTAVTPHSSKDPVSEVLKWVLFAVAVLTFALMGWATAVTYETAPPQSGRFVTSTGTVLMTGDGILAGKAGFQKADLMDYGSLYGMGSYYGPDYTATTLVRLATLTEDNLAQAQYGKPFSGLSAEQQAAINTAMRGQLQRLDLTKAQVVVPDALAAAIGAVRGEAGRYLNTVDAPAGWTPAYSLSPQDAQNTADFLVYSALTTVARRPGLDWSWTENWPYEPMVGNTPTTNTFHWTWISFCFTFFCFGAVLFIYEFYLNHPDDAPMDPVLANFGICSTPLGHSAVASTDWPCRVI